jgi:hypothetical protein
MSGVGRESFQLSLKTPDPFLLFLASFGLLRRTNERHRDYNKRKTLSLKGPRWQDVMVGVWWPGAATGLVRVTWPRFSGDLIVRRGWFSEGVERNEFF